MNRIPAGVAMLLSLAALAVPARAGEEDAATLRAYCETELTAPAEVCDCLGEKFAAMSDAQQAQVGAMIRGDEDGSMAARATLTPDEQLQAGTFLARETPVCWSRQPQKKRR